MYHRPSDAKGFICSFYKRRWKIHETAVQTEEEKMQNLDIEVPIGYNVLIVKVDKTLQN